MPTVLFEQYVEEGLGCASYLIGDEQAREAIVVDPAYAVDQYLETAERKGVRITRVLETHTHADHLSGHGRLAIRPQPRRSAHAHGRPPAQLLPTGSADGIRGAGRARLPSRRTSVAPSASNSSALVGA